MVSVPSNAIATGQATLAGTEVLVVNARGDRKRLTLINHAAVAGYIGPTGAVTSSTGALLPGVIGAQLVMETTSAIYGVGGGTISYIEEYA